ncbi:PAS domain-containing protein [Anabaena azotica]|uniref:histidine kinase n=1 Tax=Anabaena azotica FACHB-119 TaxID=947527 RepID=A0ABR8D237_9NOST|nr:PAS domain-containing protein [Anabaena azotica]MBD2500241.1 PAS domain-containing protein [Anabaena azotica FACHB-119]
MKRDTTGKFVSNWDSGNKQRFSVSLTDTAWRSLDEEAHKQGISRSELIEQFARSLACAEYTTQEQLIARLERQKQELEAVVENAPDAIARFDEQIRYLYVNRMVEQVMGRSRDELLGKFMYEVVSDPIYLFWEEHSRLTFATAKEQEIEFEFATPFGVRFYQARLVPELDDTGKPISVIVISRDLIASKQAQQQQTQLLAAQETERQVTKIIESITDAFVAFDSNWRYTYVNHAAVKILQRTPAQLIGKQVWEEVFPELVGGVAYQALHQAVAEQIPISWEEFGEPIQCWVEVNAYPFAGGMGVYFRDVTERKQAEAERERLLQALESERAQFEAVLQQLPTGVMIAEAASGKLILTNEQAKQILRYNFEESRELAEYDPIVPFHAFHSDGQIYAPHDYPLVRSLSTGEVIANEEMHLCWQDNSTIYINVNSAPIFNQQGQIVAAVVVIEDVTASKRLESALRQREQDFKMVVENATDIISRMDRNFRHLYVSPAVELATGIPTEEFIGKTNADLGMSAELDSFWQKNLQLVFTTGQQQIIEFSYPTAGGMRWYQSHISPEFNSDGSVATVVNIARDVTDYKQVEQALRESEERLQQALTATQAAQRQLTTIVETSPVGIALLDKEQRYVTINPALAQINGLTSEQHLGRSISDIFGQSDPQLVQIFVDIYNTGNPFISPNLAINLAQRSDRRKGIAPEFLPQVFEYFRLEDGATTRKFGGLGLGLAIVRHFTELHGGTVQASSQGQDLGATFTLRLPLKSIQQEKSADDSIVASMTDLTGVQILVVDDDADMRELAEFILTQSGAQVTTAASAMQALHILSKSVPDLLLCDIGMPEMDGYTLMRQIRQWSPQAGGTMKAIALTAYAGELNQQQALAAGFQKHIPKPVEPEELLQTIFQLLEEG